MSNDLAPALSQEEWSKQHPEWGTRPTKEVVGELVSDFLNADRPDAAIAVLNMYLGTDPRRVTSEVVGALIRTLTIAEEAVDPSGVDLAAMGIVREFTAALLTYLPPAQLART